MSTQPTPMKANEVRKAFTDFFVERAHSHQPSASLIRTTRRCCSPWLGWCRSRPTSLERRRRRSRAVTVQKCVCAGGKHNDLDEIGRTKRHLTFFEMMGNFSFGDYFKEDACAWAWEFVTEVIGLPADRLWVTVHLTDDEAADIWENQVGVPADRIQRLDEDNYWKMGDVGPCGPCSEIFWDKGPAFGPTAAPSMATRTASSRSGISCSCSSTSRPTVRKCRCRSRRSTPAWVLSAPSRCSRGSTRCGRPTSSRPSSRRHQASPACRRRPTIRARCRCASSPTMPGPPPCWCPTACSRRTRPAATCSAASCGGPSAMRTSSESSLRSWAAWSMP